LAKKVVGFEMSDEMSKDLIYIYGIGQQKKAEWLHDLLHREGILDDIPKIDRTIKYVCPKCTIIIIEECSQVYTWVTTEEGKRKDIVIYILNNGDYNFSFLNLCPIDYIKNITNFPVNLP